MTPRMQKPWLMCSLSGVPAFHCFPRCHSCTGFCREGLPTRSLAAVKLPAQAFPSSRRPGVVQLKTGWETLCVGSRAKS
eukprot:5265673-Prymnesium_polylepis.1